MTKGERAEWRQRLQRPCSIEEFRGAYSELKQLVGFHFHTQAGLEFAREAWVAIKLAEALSATSVCLSPEDRPDVVLIENGVERLFEVVEASDPDRRRSNDYRDLIRRRAEGETEFQEVEDFKKIDEHAQQVPDWLRAAAEKKAAKPYLPGTALAIYLNYGDYGSHTRKIVSAMPLAIAPALSKFSEVVILWQSQLYRFAGISTEN